MKRLNRIIAVLCLALLACMILPAATPAALAKAALTADRTDVKLVKGEKAVVTLTFPYVGSIGVKWDNAKVAKCKLSQKWEGDKTTMTITALSAGKTTVSLTNSKSKDVLKIKVTVVSKDAKQELRAVMGKTVKAANKTLADELKATAKGYDNGSFRVGRNTLKRINKIVLYGGKGGYRLFGTYPGMKLTAAVSTLKKKGWKLARKSSSGDIYLSESDPAHAIRLKKKSAKVSQVIYYVP